MFCVREKRVDTPWVEFSWMKTTKRKRGLQDEKNPHRSGGQVTVALGVGRPATPSGTGVPIWSSTWATAASATRRAISWAPRTRTASSPATRKGRTARKCPTSRPIPSTASAAGDLTYYLKTGFRPDGDVAGGAMSGVIEGATAHLSDADRVAIAAYLSSLSPNPRQ